MQFLCSAKMSCLHNFRENNSQSFIYIKNTEKNIVGFNSKIHFVELNFKWSIQHGIVILLGTSQDIFMVSQQP